MKDILLVSALACAGLTVLACSAGRPPARETITKSADGRTAPASAYADLGRATVDVSGYPERVQAGYRRFTAVCGSCHTAARPLNSAYASEADWRQYVGRMRGRMRELAMRLTKNDEERIVEFLVYDSLARKIRGKDAFEAEQQRLKELFEQQQTGVRATGNSSR